MKYLDVQPVRLARPVVFVAAIITLFSLNIGREPYRTLCNTLLSLMDVPSSWIRINICNLYPDWQYYLLYWWIIVSWFFFLFVFYVIPSYLEHCIYVSRLQQFNKGVHSIAWTFSQIIISLHFTLISMFMLQPICFCLISSLLSLPL